MSRKHEIIGMAGAAEMYHDATVKIACMKELLSDCRDRLESMAPECGCGYGVCPACFECRAVQELVKRIKQLTGDEK